MSKTILEFQNMQYVMNTPAQYKEGEKYPVIIFLHGAGSRGKRIEPLINNPYFQITDPKTDFPFITLAPHCSKDTWFDIFETLQSFVQNLVSFPYVDPQRIYLMGASMGGYAVWQLAMSMPEYFAAICPICGGGMYWNAGRLINIPIWAFHGGKDDVVSVEESKKMVNAVNRAGGNAKLTIYPENMHNAWSDTYDNKEVYEWMLSHKNKNSAIITDSYKGSQLYG